MLKIITLISTLMLSSCSTLPPEEEVFVFEPQSSKVLLEIENWEEWHEFLADKDIESGHVSTGTCYI